jgi:hypothetical protein
MRRFAIFRPIATLVLLGAFSLLLAACAGRARPDSVASPDVPSTFDMTVLADKDGQFDLDGATLAGEDLKSHLRYRAEQGNAVGSIILKRGVKQKVSDRHIVELAKAASELKLRVFVQEDEGKEIQEIRGVTAAQ